MADMQMGPAGAGPTEPTMGANPADQQRAIKLLDEAERRIDELLDAAEKLFNRGAGYSERARTWMNEHRDYKVKAEQIITKAGDYRERMRGFGSSSSPEGEGTSAFASMRESGRERLQDLGARARGSVSGAGSFVRENPADAILIGAALGVLVGTAFKHLRTGEATPEAPEGGTSYGV